MLVGKSYHSLSHCMTFTKILVSFESVQYKQSAFAFFVQLKFVQAERLRIFVQLKLVWEKMIMGITYAHIERSTGK